MPNPSRLPTPPPAKPGDMVAQAAQDLSYDARRIRNAAGELDPEKISEKNPDYCAQALRRMVKAFQGF